MNSPYFQEGNVPPLCEDWPTARWGARDSRSPAAFRRPLPQVWWLRPWRVKLARQAVLDAMVEQFGRASKEASVTLDNSLIIKTELLSQADFDAIFNPGWVWVDGIVYRAESLLKATLSNLYEKTQVL
jgi:hypothetical protein